MLFDGKFKMIANKAAIIAKLIELVDFYNQKSRHYDTRGWANLKEKEKFQLHEYWDWIDDWR